MLNTDIRMSPCAANQRRTRPAARRARQAGFAFAGFLVAFLALSASALPDSVQKDFTFATNGSALTITEYRGTNTAVIIPEMVYGYPVTTIGEQAFANKAVGTVTIRAPITNIAPNAFVGCEHLTNIALPETVLTIGEGAFFYCAALGTLRIPDSTVSIGEQSFSRCYGLTNITLGKSLASIGPWAFYECTNLPSVAIPGSVTNLSKGVFAYCSSLVSVVLPRSITSIEDETFTECGSLNAVVLQDTLTNIGSDAFVACSSLAEIAIPNSVTHIGSGAFLGTGIKTIFIPPSVTAIDFDPYGQPFESLSLTNITVDPENPAYCSVDGVLFDKLQTAIIQFPPGKTGSYVIPDTVTTIAELQFLFCQGLESISIPHSVTNFGATAFSDCNNLGSATIASQDVGILAFEFCGELTNVTLLPGVTAIRAGAFSACTNLAHLSIPSGVKIIESEVFRDCRKLRSITIPDTVTSLGNPLLYYCTNLSAIYFLGDAPYYSGTLFGAANLTVYYLPGKAGWYRTYGGCPAVPWHAEPQPEDASFGIHTNRFGFTIVGTSNLVVVIEACTNLAGNRWVAVKTNRLFGGSYHFIDGETPGNASRFYRVRSM